MSFKSQPKHTLLSLVTNVAGAALLRSWLRIASASDGRHTCAWTGATGVPPAIVATPLTRRTIAGPGVVKLFEKIRPDQTSPFLLSRGNIGLFQ